MSILLTQQGPPADITTTGALAAGASVLAGTLVSGSTVTGALQAGSSTASGLVDVSDAAGISIAGTLTAQASTVAGTLVGSSEMAGALSAQASAVSGSLVGSSTATGTLTAQAAQASGALTVGWLLKSPDVYLLEGGTDKYLQEDASGFYRREEIALTAEASTVSGAITVTGGEIGGSGDNDGIKRRRKTLHLPFKPTGLIDRQSRRNIEPLVSASLEISAEVTGSIAKEFSQDTEARTAIPSEQVSLSAIDAEIGELLHKELQAQDMEVVLMLLAACVEARAI